MKNDTQAALDEASVGSVHYDGVAATVDTEKLSKALSEKGITVGEDMGKLALAVAHAISSDAGVTRIDADKFESYLSGDAAPVPEKSAPVPDSPQTEPSPGTLSTATTPTAGDTAPANPFAAKPVDAVTEPKPIDDVNVAERA